MNRLERFIYFWAIYLLPLVPFQFIEPTHVGKDPNKYSDNASFYMYFLGIFFFICWYYMAVKVLNGIETKFFTKNKNHD